ncbi:hypothetical protein N7501_003420 [Penicillium viridicatum]|nr:hypothetical protein N7501_003420 [Penicillium viridicatum]
MSNTIYNDGNLDALEKPEDVSEYIIFSIDTATHDLDFLNPNVEPKLGIRTIFDQNIDSLAIKIYHAYCSKQPDRAWGLKRPPIGNPRRPTVVVEVVITETHTNLIRDIGRWLDPIDGLAKVGLAIKADRRKPKITIKRWQYKIAKAEIENVQTIEMIERSEGDEVTLTAGPLLIPFHLFFLRPAETPREGDIIIDENPLKEIAQEI